MTALLDCTASEAMTSPHLFGSFFAGPSWNTWYATVKGTFGEPMPDGDERALFRAVAGRDPPAQRVRELVVAAGRGAGKDSIASFLAAYLAVTFVPKGKLRPGERAYVLCLAVDKSQAAIAFRYISGYFEAIPALAAMVTNVGPSSIDLSNGVTIEVIINSYRAVRGRSILAAIFDEAAFWREENFASPDIEVYNAVSPGLARVPGSMLLIISSVHKRSGLLYQKIKDNHGKDDPTTLAVMGSTATFNPSFPQHIIDEAIEDDPEKFGAEYLCRWRDDLSTFIDRVLLDAAVDPGVVVRAPAAGIRYIAACDASGGRNDSFTAAICHKERDGTIVLDMSFERKAPFNPSEVVGEIVRLMKEYRCHEITGDNYGAAWIVEAFAKAGARYVKSDRDRSAVYMDCLPLFTSGRARLLDNPKLLSQFASLERRTFSTGRERIDPGPGHDDLCNSAAIALSLLDLKKSMIVSADCVAAVSRQMPDRYGRPNRFTSRPRMPLTFTGSASNLAQPAASSPAAPSSSFGSVSYSDKFGNK